MIEFQGNRLKEIRSFAKKTQQEFAERLGITRSKVSDIEAGNQKITTELAEKISKVFNVNFEWLLTGKGQMFNSPTIQHVQQSIDEETNTLSALNFPFDPTTKELPFFETGIPCGIPAIKHNDDSQILKMPAVFAENADFIVVAQGNSMIDAGIHHNTLLFCRQQKYFKSGDIVLLCHPDGSSMCRKIIETTSKIIFKSCNKDKQTYPDIEIPKPLIKPNWEVFAKVIRVITDF
jgi:SOS-response transcriptional repressor LexA